MANNITVVYYLNEDGRKKNLLAGGDGKQEQSLTIPLSEKLLKWAEVDTTGYVRLDLKQRPNLQEQEVHGEGVYFYDPLVGHKIMGNQTEKYQFVAVYPRWSSEKVTFSNTLAESDVIAFLEKVEADINTLQAQVTTTREQAEEKIKAEFPAFKAQKQEEFENSIAELKANRAREEQERQEELSRKERQKQDQADWIAQYGSERLKLCQKGNYPCKKLYLEERVLHELGEGWFIDTKNEAEIEDRANPSLEALTIVETLPEGYTGEVVWITSTPSALSTPAYFSPQEAVWIRGCPFTTVNIYKLMD
ncbi:MAG: hypothetical protein PHU23_03260 [Dehalococcoidales bacterium]|nr:hypothetical protein [Dehalococcoidales bacterium]